MPSAVKNVAFVTVDGTKLMAGQSGAHNIQRVTVVGISSNLPKLACISNVEVEPPRVNIALCRGPDDALAQVKLERRST